jgi:hypothetical protein
VDDPPWWIWPLGFLLAVLLLVAQRATSSAP